MRLKHKFRNVFRAIKQLWGSSGVKQSVWDKEYAGGRWDHCDHTPGAHVYGYIEKHCRNGSILDLGCGSGNTGNELNVDKYQSYVGVDISEVAAQKAAQRSEGNGRAVKNRFLQGDIITYVPEQKHDVILFRESIYYVPVIKIKGVLDRYAGYLKEQGVFVVQVSKFATKRGRKIKEIIERHYTVVDRGPESVSDNYVVVFRNHA